MFLQVSHLDVVYRGRSQPAVRQVSLGLRAGDIGVLIGPSGCGKTTLLRAVAGLESVSGGEIRLDGQVVSRVGQMLPPENRRIGMVFQDYALFPHLDVGQNVAFGLNALAREHRAARVDEVLSLVGLDGSARRFPHELSGGQRQRVGVARALAAKPKIVLMDEPFGALDPLTRDALGEDYRTLHRDLGLTTVMITHDMTEALLLADRVAVMSAGRLVAHGNAQELSKSDNTYVRELLNTPRRQAERLQELLPKGAA